MRRTRSREFDAPMRPHDAKHKTASRGAPGHLFILSWMAIVVMDVYRQAFASMTLRRVHEGVRIITLPSKQTSI
jgi:hypothetical protein